MFRLRASAQFPRLPDNRLCMPLSALVPMTARKPQSLQISLVTGGAKGAAAAASPQYPK